MIVPISQTGQIVGNNWGDYVKKGWVSWWIANGIWIALFAIGTFIVWTREVDGAGVTQTPELKLVAFIVLLIAFIIPLTIQIIWMIINLKKDRPS
ncbi:membrane protein [Oceanobacillus picturae]|uniref:Membrane protein n=1 Tax=Oceanobacillus picturae TaxID=171693 RepID=A0A0U9H4R1_9BACI|nr:membrane protein [Oceanobacillus picturae]